MSNGLLYSANYNSFTNVLSLVDKGGNVICEFDVPNATSELALKALENNSSVSLGASGTVANTFEVNTGSGWTAYTFGTTINLNKGEVCKWRCSNYTAAQDDNNHVKFAMTGSIKAYGSVASMLSSNYESITSLSGYPYAFSQLFSDCASLKIAPELPIDKLSDGCYDRMFSRCTGLTIPPELPARTLTNMCYNSMFYGCTSLTKAPELPALTVLVSSYRSMFGDCTSLTQAPELPATTVSTSSYKDMFSGCTSLTQAPATLPATILGEECYSNMFQNCSSLVNVPELVYTGRLPNYACQYMFQNCSHINEVRIWATGVRTNSLSIWLSGVAASGKVYANPTMSQSSLPLNSVSGVPSGWTREDINNYPN